MEKVKRPGVARGCGEGGVHRQAERIFRAVKAFCCFLVTISVQFSLVTQSCQTLSDPIDCSTPGFPVHHQFLELTQTHIHRVSDAIQPSHPLSFPSSPAFNLSQHQGFLQ